MATSSSEATDGDNQVIARIPNLDIAQWRFLILHDAYPGEKKAEIWKDKLLPAIEENEMAPFYEELASQISFEDSPDLAKLKAQNEKKLAEFEAEIEDATANLGESEVKDAWLRKANYLCQIGAKETALSALRQTFEKTVGIGNRIDLVFQLIRVGLFHNDHQLISANIARATELMEQGGDWDRKNRLKAYEALYQMSVRDFKAAAALFLDAVPTFGSYELMTYEQLVAYTVIASLLALDRPDVRAKVVRGAEVQEQLTGGGAAGELSLLRHFAHSLYDCRYDAFFTALAALEDQRLKFDRYLAPHYGYYVRAMRVKAYRQFLAPYKTVGVASMARAFGVSAAFLDRELHALIGSGSLHCRVDAVRGIVEKNHPDSKNDLYKTVIRDGDILLNRVQKLSRVINA